MLKIESLGSLHSLKVLVTQMSIRTFFFPPLFHCAGRLIICAKPQNW